MKHKTVNISNFETYIVDYFDGKLSETEQQALFTFLETHPELMADFELFIQSQDAVIQPDTLEFPCPERLKKNVVFNDKRRLKRMSFRFSPAIWVATASMAAVLLLFFLFRTNSDVPSLSVTPEPVFVQTGDNEREMVFDTMGSDPQQPSGLLHSVRNDGKPSGVIASAAKQSSEGIEEGIAGQARNNGSRRNDGSMYNDGKRGSEPAEEHYSESMLPAPNTEVAASDFTEIVRVLEPEVVLIKTIPESEPATEDLLTANQTQPQKKHSLWKALSWGVRQYNNIAKDEVAIVKVENLTTNETVYYLCRKE